MENSHKKKVVILYKYLPEWRKSFFERLKERLNESNIQLDLYYGKLKSEESLRADEVDLNWAHFRDNKIVRVLGKEIYWQPVWKDIQGADMVIVEQASKLLINYLLMFSRIYSGRKFAFWGHGRNMQEKENSFWNKFKKVYTNKCDWWFAYTQGVANYLEKGGYGASRITVVQNSIDSTRLKYYRDNLTKQEVEDKKKELGIGNGPVAIFSGGLVEIKGIDFLMEACEIIKKRIPQFEIIILGSGLLRKKVEDWAEKHEWVHYLGTKFDKEKVIYFSMADIMMVPGLIGLVIIDAFAFETPLFTTLRNYPIHSPEFEYLRNHQNGVCTPVDVQLYVNAVVEVLNTPAELNRLKNECRKDANKYTIERMVDNFYSGIIGCLNG